MRDIKITFGVLSSVVLGLAAGAIVASLTGVVILAAIAMGATVLAGGAVSVNAWAAN